MKRALSISIVLGAMTFAPNAHADCSARIEAVKSHPSVVPAEELKDGATAGVVEGGGVTKYKSGGPALPRENWFGSKPELSSVLGYLSAAEAALKAGKTKECNDKISSAEKILSKPQN